MRMGEFCQNGKLKNKENRNETCGRTNVDKQLIEIRVNNKIK